MPTKRLELFFLNQDGKRSKISVNEPRADLTDTEVQTAMQNIITANIFNSSGGDLMQVSSARIVTTDITDIIEE